MHSIYLINNVNISLEKPIKSVIVQKIRDYE